MPGHSFIQQFIQREEQLVPHGIRHYPISTSMRMRSSLSFGFQTDQVE